MGVYSNRQIAAGIASGHIICHPFEPRNISHASLDVTLGHYFYRTENTSGRHVYNPFSKKDIDRYFGEEQVATKHGDWAVKNGFAIAENIPKDHPIIALRPGERILAHTHEFFGIKPPGALEIKARSSWGRNGVAVCFDAGWVDPGYINRLTLEIYNLNQKDTVLLPVGERIAQAIFVETGDVEGNYGSGRDDGFSGKYQSGTELDQLISKWKPEHMLPRSHLDKRIKPTKIKGVDYL